MKRRDEGMTDTQYLLYLWERQAQMRKEVLKLCQQEESVTFAAIYRQLEERYCIQKKEAGRNEILTGVCKNLLSILVAKGELAVCQSKGEQLYSMEKKTNAA